MDPAVAGREELLAALAARDAALVERDAVIAALQERIVELERRLGSTPRNSHQPPSSEGYAKPPPKSRRRRSGRKPGGQPGSPGTTLAQVADPDVVIAHCPGRCSGCRRSLRDAPVTSVETRQVADLPEVALRWTEHRIEHRRCACGRTTMAGGQDGVPDRVRAPVQYGPGVQAVATYLVAGHFLPVARAAQLMSDLLAAPVATGAVAGWVAGAGSAVSPFTDRVRQLLSAAPVVHFDETGLRVEGRLAWVHSASTGSLTLYGCHPRRGVEAMRAVGVLPGFPGVAVHDCWAPYFTFPAAHALCNAHVLRELAGVYESTGQAWAAKLAVVLERANRAVTAAKDSGADQLDPDLLARLRANYAALCAQGHADNPAPAGGWGRGKRPVAVNLLDRLDTHAEEFLRFTVDFRVPFTNNPAEQDIRPVKLRQKISGCLRTMAGARAFCALRSYLSTARKQGRSALDVLRQLHEGQPWLPDPGTC